MGTMIVRILVEYERVGDDEYVYVEWFERILSNKCDVIEAKDYTRHKVVRDLIKRGIVIKKIKELEIEILC